MQMTTSLPKSSWSLGLKKTVRHRAPIDGHWFRATANLNSIMRAVSLWNDDMSWPKFTEDTRVPVWISMRLYKGGDTRTRPDGMRYGPVIKVGEFDSVEFEMFSHHHAAGLSYDYTLDWKDDDRDDKWMYFPVDGDHNPRGEDVSFYYCKGCDKTLYRDDKGERSHNSACIFKGALVCRDCEVVGLVMDGEADAQLMRCYALANHLGAGHSANLARQVDSLRGGFSFSRPAQTRLWREDSYSFNWSTTIFEEDGTKRRGMNGGLIQHGPHPIENGVDGYTFRTWDYKAGVDRDATPDEVQSIHWSIHT